MTRRLLTDSGGGAGFETDCETARAATSRGMAEVLTALDIVIDDEAALGRVFAQAGVRGPAVTAPRSSGSASSRRRLAVRCVAALAATALAAGAVALRVMGVPEAEHSSADNQADRASYVVRRVSTALRAADLGDIAQLTVTTQDSARAGGPVARTTSREWSRGDQWRAVTYSSAGHPVYGEGWSTASRYTLVSYLTRTWARQPGTDRAAAQASGAGHCGPAATALPLLFQPGLPVGDSAASSPLTVAGKLRAAVSCGSLAAAGRQRIDGIEAIRLTSGPASRIAETVWINPATYLPVRVVIRPALTKPELLTADITWLPPTAQHLARLAVPVPAGFRRRPLAAAAAAVSQDATG
jgi:hypothetical protein